MTSFKLENLTASSQHIIYVTASNENGESRASETLIAWTDPAFEPVVEVPTVHPMNLVLENGTMTVICVAMGTPMPTISLYVSGNLMKQEKTRHMVAVVPNVTRSMSLITCYAENGYGQPSESSKRIIIGRTYSNRSLKSSWECIRSIIVPCVFRPAEYSCFSRNPGYTWGRCHAGVQSGRAPHSQAEFQSRFQQSG